MLLTIVRVKTQISDKKLDGYNITMVMVSEPWLSAEANQ